jgi:hypothetical protein
VQEKSRDKGPAEGQAEEREARDKGRLPELLDKGLQNWGLMLRLKVSADTFRLRTWIFFLFVQRLKMEVNYGDTKGR